MPKESGVKDPVPSLEEYLEVVKKEEAKRLAAAERVPPEPVEAKSTPNPANAESVKRMLF